MKFVSQRISGARSKAGLTQSALAEEVGKSLRAIQNWESGVNEPTGTNLRKLCAVLGVTPEYFFEDTPKKYPEHKPNAHIMDEKTASEKLRMVPVISWASAGAANDYSDMEHSIDRHVATSSKDPNAFALIVEGDSMEPRFIDGDVVVCSPNAEPRNGDYVVARLSENHGVMFKRYRRRGESGQIVVLESLNPDYKPREFQAKDFRFIYPAIEVWFHLPRGLNSSR